MTPLIDTLRACVPLLPDEFRQTHAALFVSEHLEKLAARLQEFHQKGVPDERPLPHFAAEVTPSLKPAFEPFREALDGNQTAVFAEAILKARCANMLLLLGQRLTPASVTDERGIPPTCQRLLTAANKPHLDTEKLTVAGRALTKHVHRSPEVFWGEVAGSAEQKNAAAVRVLQHILDNRTWWNVFGHFQHDLVFERVCRGGHGARWGHSGDEFIGFLEPFDEDKCPTLKPTDGD